MLVSEVQTHLCYALKAMGCEPVPGERERLETTSTDCAACFQWRYVRLLVPTRRRLRLMDIFISFKLVWKEACGLFDDMIEAEGWKDKASVDLVPVNDITTKVTSHRSP